jgi:adenine phosphoribosyltransferase
MAAKRKKTKPTAKAKATTQRVKVTIKSALPKRPPVVTRRVPDPVRVVPARVAARAPAAPPVVALARGPAMTLAPLTDGLAFAASKIRNIADFPKPGILFKDITPLLASPRAFHIVLDAIAERFIGEHIDAVVGVEARGFIFGGALAARLNASFVPARKPGKLPALCDQVTYETEYSLATLEMHKDSIVEESRVIVVDDLLATGGTARAAAELVRRQGGYVVAYAFAVELTFLGGREKLLPVKVESAIQY